MLSDHAFRYCHAVVWIAVISTLTSWQFAVAELTACAPQSVDQSSCQLSDVPDLPEITDTALMLEQKRNNHFSLHLLGLTASPLEIQMIKSGYDGFYAYRHQCMLLEAPPTPPPNTPQAVNFGIA